MKVLLLLGILAASTAVAGDLPCPTYQVPVTSPAFGFEADPHGIFSYKECGL